MAKRTVTLYVDDSTLRLVIADGRGIGQFAESRLDPGLIDNNIILNDAEVASAIKQLFSNSKVGGSKINLGISGSRCFTRPITLPKLPKEMLAEAVTREAQRLLPVAIEELYLSWQLIPAQDDQTRVFIVGIPRKTADPLFRTMRKAGLRVGFMEIKPLLLARAIKEPAAIVVDVQSGEFDIVVAVDGVLHPVRSIRFANTTLSNDEKMATIRNELSRSLGFYDTTYPEKPLKPDVPILVSGLLAAEPALKESLAKQFGHPVAVLTPPIETSDGQSAAHYMANICLAVPVSSQKQNGTANVSAINAVPPAYQSRAVSLANVVVVPGGVTTAALLAFLVLFGRSLSDDIASINTQIVRTNQQLQQKQLQQKELTSRVSELEKELGAVTAARDSLNSVVDVLETQAGSTGGDLAVAISSPPRDLSLSSIRRVGDILTLMGSAQFEKQVLSYVDALDGSGLFGSIVLTDLTRDENEEIDFTIVGTLQAKGIGASSTQVALGSLPSTLTLTSVTSGEGSLAIQGTAPNPDRLFAYLRALEASGEFEETTIVSIVRTDEENITFSLALKTGE